MIDKTRGTRESCTCAKCRSACSFKPGWFMPGEVEKAATFLGKPLDAFFEEKLAIDYWLGDPNIFVLSPAIIGSPAGGMFPANPRGRCVFFKDGRCEIHPVKPYECQMAFHADSYEAFQRRHAAVRDNWMAHQEQIKTLYGSVPYAPDSSILDFL